MGQIIHFLVNASPPRPSNVANTDFAGAYRVLGNISCDLKILIMYINLIYKTTGCSNVKLCRCISHMMLRVLGNI